jgi:hypothetical protein
MTRSAGHRLDRPGFGKARGACPSLAELVVGRKDTPVLLHRADLGLCPAILPCRARLLVTGAERQKPRAEQAADRHRMSTPPSGGSSM